MMDSRVPRLNIHHAVPFCAFFGLWFGTHVWAGNTGTISGTVTDKESADRLPGVNIVVEGTTMGAASDGSGEFIIVGVPAGRYTVTVTSIGYAAVKQENVVVLPDFSTRLRFELTPASLMGEEVVITAERPLLQRDQTMTMTVTSAEEIQTIPMRGFQSIANMSAGVVVNNTRNIEGGTATVHLRGGRPNETGVYVDGFQQNNLMTGLSNVTVPNTAVEEVVTITGAYDAEYGRNQSGIILVTTKSGRDRYSGQIEWVGDPWGLGIAESYGYNVYSANIGGPLLPGNNRIKFYLAGEARNILDAEPSVFGFPKYTLSNAGVISQDSTVMDTVIFDTDQNGHVRFKRGPRPKTDEGYGSNSDRGFAFQSKVSCDVISGKFRLDVHANHALTVRRQFLVNGTLNPDLSDRREYRNLNVGAMATYLFSPSSFADLAVNYHDNRRRIINDEYGPSLANYMGRSAGNTGSGSYYSDLLLFDIAVRPFNTYRRDEDAYVGVKFNYTNQIDKHNQVRAGADYFRHTIRFLNNIGFDNPTVQYNAGGFTIDHPENPTVRRTGQTDLENQILGPAHPVTFSAYLQDKAEYEGLVVRAGIRYDRFNAGARRIKNLADPTGQLDPAQEFAYTDRNGNGVFDENTDRPWAGTVGPEDYNSARTDTRFSPRISVGFPISEKTQFRMSYGVFFQQPSLETLYSSPAYLDRVSNSGGDLGGNPNLKAEECSQYEVGLHRVFAEKLIGDAVVYYKDIRNLISYRVVSSNPNAIFVYDNWGDAIVKGLSISLELRRTGKFQGRLAYTLQSAQGIGSSETSNFFEIGSFRYPLVFDQRHTLDAHLDIRNGQREGLFVGGNPVLQNAGIGIHVRAGSGFPYTPTSVSDLRFGFSSGRWIAPLNSQTTPWTFRVDLTADKSVGLAGHNTVRIYIQILNLLDTKNVLSVFESTGDAGSNGFPGSESGQYLNERQLQQYDVWFHDGFKYDTPRQARLGIVLSF